MSEFEFSPNISKSSKGSKKQTPTLEQDPEVSQLHDHLDKVEEAIANCQAESKAARAAYESEIQRLEGEIEKAKIDAETKLSQQREEHVAELNELREKQEAEIEQLQHDIAKTQKHRSKFSEQHLQASRVQKEALLADLRHQIEYARIEHEENTYSTTAQCQQAVIDNQQKEVELQAQIEMLDADIKDIGASRMEELQKARLKADEINSTMEAMTREQSSKVDRYKMELQKRQQICNEHIESLESQAEMERQQLENELQAVKSRMDSLQKLLTQTDRRNQRELQITKQDIQTLKDSLETAQQREQSQIDIMRQQIDKLHAAQQDNIQVEQEIESIRAQLEQIKHDNVSMRKERQRMDTQMYTSRISQHRSTLH